MLKKLMYIVPGVIFLGSSTISYAEEGISYNLTQHSLSEHYTILEEGELIDVTIEDRTPCRLSNKNYTVTKAKKGYWKVSYTVTIQSNKIKSVSNLRNTASIGKFNNNFLNKKSSTLSEGGGIWKYNAITQTIKATAKITNNNLTIQ